MSEVVKYPKLHTTDLAQELYTPPSATAQIVPFIPKGLVVWEMCYGRGDMANALRDSGISVVGDKNMDCFIDEPEAYDIIVTNPPYRNNKDFLERAIKSGKPFALLMRLEHIGGVRASDLLKDLDIKILIPKRRINFITPKMRDGKSVGGSQFHTIWVTYKLVDDPRQIIYLEEPTKLEAEL